MTQRKKSLLVFLFFSCDATRPTWALAVSLGKISRALSLSVSAKYAGEFRISPSWRLFACLVRNPGGIIPIKIFVLVSFRRRAQGAFSSFHSKLRVPTCHEGKSHRSSPTRRTCADWWLAWAPANFFLFVSIKKMVTCQLGGLVHSCTTPVGAPAWRVEPGFFLVRTESGMIRWVSARVLSYYF